MRLRGLLWFNAAFSIMPVALLAGAVVEGRIELSQSHTAPVQAKRYEIVTKGGVLSTQPPLAVVYLDGAFPKSSFATDERGRAKGFGVHSGASPRYESEPRLNSQVLMTPTTAFFPTHRPNDLISAVIGRTSDRFRYKFSTSQVWSHCGATFTNTCAA